MLGFARTFLRLLRKKRFAYTPLIEVGIKKDAILHNVKAFQELRGGIAVAPVLKSNAYGHGLIEVARILDRRDLPFLCVDSYFEALILRNEGIRSPILILGYTPIENILGNQLPRLAFGVVSLDGLREIAARAERPVTIHLKIDTGMHRHGISPDDIERAILSLRTNARLSLEGIYSHLADADTSASEHTKTQIQRWNEAAARMRKEFPRTRYFHCAATSGSFYAKEIDANVMRLGIGLYGMNESLSPLDLRPALEMRTRITSIRTVPAGESVGYNATFKAPRDMSVATIPVGYAEGVDRRLSGKGAVLMGERVCPIVGRVSMNITSVDVSGVEGAAVNDSVAVIGRIPSAPNSVERIAELCGTIPYEILVHIPAHLRRIVE